MFETLVAAVVFSFATSGVASGIMALGAWQRPRLLAAAVMVSTAVAFALGLARSGPFPSLPPPSAVGWTPWLILAAAALGAADTLAPPRRCRWDIALCLAVVTAGLMLRRLVPHHLDVGGFFVAGLGASALLFVLLQAPASVEGRRARPLPRAPMAFALFAAAPTIGWSSSGTLAMLVATLAASVAGAWTVLAIAARGRPRESLGFVPGVGLGASLMAAWAYADLEVLHALLLVASALCVLIDGPGKTRRIAHAGLALSVVLAGTAAALAHHAATARGASPFGL